jgi:hypothetical protein
LTSQAVKRYAKKLSLSTSDWNAAGASATSLGFGPLIFSLTERKKIFHGFERFSPIRPIHLHTES